MADNQAPALRLRSSTWALEAMSLNTRTINATGTRNEAAHDAQAQTSGNQRSDAVDAATRTDAAAT